MHRFLTFILYHRRISSISRNGILAVFYLLTGMILLAPLAETEAAGKEPPTNLSSLSLQELMEIEIVSAAKKPETVSESAAAVYVITQDDIRRSGATCIPEALRLAPGVEVARIDTNQWAITIRGFNQFFSSKLLVMIDGRTIYTHLFSGVYWDQQDTLMEDIDRIEVVRGPGAALWGANAVNGVINIITKKSKDTQGGLATVSGGNQERFSSGLRYGGKIDETLTYRVYGKYFDRDRIADNANHTPAIDSGSKAIDDWRSGRGGFRMDWAPTKANSLSLQGEAFKNGFSEEALRFSLDPPSSYLKRQDSTTSGGHLMGRAKHEFSDTSEISAQLYYDRANWDTLGARVWTDTIDLELQHRFYLGTRQEIVWGLGCRVNRDGFDNFLEVQFQPNERELYLYSAFIQDEIRLIENMLRLTVGSRFEHNDFTGFEVEPTVRLLWEPVKTNIFWGAVSRAVRTPSRIERDSQLNFQLLPPGSLYPNSPVGFMSEMGTNKADSETMIAYELGYRLQPTNKWRFDIATFYNDYAKLREFEAGTPFMDPNPSPHLIVPLYANNHMKGEAYGVEVAADWQVTNRWGLSTTYSFLHLNLHMTDNSQSNYEALSVEGRSPHHQASLRSSLKITDDVHLNLWLRFVDSLPYQNVDNYTSLDARLAWKPIKSLELSLVGQNLLQGSHAEYSQFEINRGVYGKAVWSF
ncbi:MAG: TonB-dependent receptor [Deltaproteobacteria bacterium]|nr:TonB-dependent receptor [Deltaproteobacteria bacterium]